MRLLRTASRRLRTTRRTEGPRLVCHERGAPNGVDLFGSCLGEPGLRVVSVVSVGRRAAERFWALPRCRT